MIDIRPQFVIDDRQEKKAIILSMEDWEKVLDALEELEDIQDYLAAKAGPQETIPLEQAIREIEEGKVS